MIYSDLDNREYMFRTRITFDGNWLVLNISKDASLVNKTWLAKVDRGGLLDDGTHLRYMAN